MYYYLFIYLNWSKLYCLKSHENVPPYHHLYFQLKFSTLKLISFLVRSCLFILVENNMSALCGLQSNNFIWYITVTVYGPQFHCEWELNYGVLIVS